MPTEKNPLDQILEAIPNVEPGSAVHVALQRAYDAGRQAGINPPDGRTDEECADSLGLSPEAVELLAHAGVTPRGIVNGAKRDALERRQAFLDAAAMAASQASLSLPAEPGDTFASVASEAYAYAQALWDERERRRAK